MKNNYRIQKKQATVFAARNFRTYSIILLLAFALFGTGLRAQIITTIAGNGTPGYSGDGGPATAAQIGYEAPKVAVDGIGNVYIADYNNAVIRKVNTTGIITTFAGNGISGYNGDGIPAIAADINGPWGIAIDGSGNVFLADAGNHLIREISISGIITTIAGGGSSISDGVPATLEALPGSYYVSVDAGGNVYFNDEPYNRIRKVSPAGIITTVAGNVTPGYSGDGGPAIAAELNHPRGIAVDGSGNLYIADFGNHVVRMVNALGIISTVAGNGTPGFSGDGGPAIAAECYNPSDVSVDGSGNIYIADFDNNRIRKVNASGIITTLAGNGTAGYIGDGGPATAAELSGFAYGVTVDASGNVYIADGVNSKIRKVSAPTGSSLAASSLPTSVLCYGESTGRVTVTATGGATPYTGTVAHTGLSAGTYTYTVTDAHGNTSATLATVTQPGAPLNIAATATNVLCYGTSTGSITTTVTGGTSPYSYLWELGSTSPDRTDIGISSHELTVTDAHGCTALYYVVLTQPAALTLSAGITNVSCYGGSNGSISTTAGGGTPGYTYLWSGPGGYSSTSGHPSGMAPGAYSVTVTDANSCTKNATYTITAPATSVSITEEGIDNVSCYGGSNGRIYVAGSGGTPGYTYLWSNGATTSSITGLSAITYSVSVTDSRGCTDVAAYTITQPVALIPSITVTPNPPAHGGAPFTVYTGYGTSILSLRANETGGTSPYTYSWATSTGSSLAPVDSVVVEVLVTKTFTITVTDHNGCTGTAVQTITVKDIESSAGHVYLCNEGTTEIVDTSAVYTELETGYYTLGPCPESGRKANTANDSANARGGLPTDAAIQVYPNPTEGTFSVEIPGIYKDAEIEVTDVTGRVIESRKVTDNTGVPEQFSLTDVAKGVYIVKVSTEGTSFVTKLIVR